MEMAKGVGRVGVAFESELELEFFWVWVGLDGMRFMNMNQ